MHKLYGEIVTVTFGYPMSQANEHSSFVTSPCGAKTFAPLPRISGSNRFSLKNNAPDHKASRIILGGERGIALRLKHLLLRSFIKICKHIFISFAAFSCFDYRPDNGVRKRGISAASRLFCLLIMAKASFSMISLHSTEPLVRNAKALPESSDPSSIPPNK